MPDELTVQIGVLSGPDGQPVVFLAPTWSGSTANGVGWIERLKALGTPVVADAGAMSYSTMLGQFDPHVISGRHYEIRTRTLQSIGDGAIEALLRAGDSRASAFSGIAIHHFHGAATRVPLDETAFGIRSEHLVVEIVAAWDPADDAARQRYWADTVYSELGPHSLKGGCPNLIGPEQADQADSAYGPNAGRLLAAKRRYDPNNVFSATPYRRRDRPESGDLGGQLAHYVAQVRGHLDVLPRVFPVERFGRHRQLEVLDHPRARDAEGLAGLVVRPHPAVLAMRRADDGHRLVLQRTVAERPRQPVDRVLQHAGNAAVVLRGDDEGGVGVGSRGAQRHDRRWHVVVVDVLVVERQAHSRSNSSRLTPSGADSIASSTSCRLIDPARRAAQ